MRQFRKALSGDPGDAQSILGIGLVYQRLQMAAESVRWIERSIELGSAADLNVGLLVQACSSLDAAADGIEVLERIISLVGEDPRLMRTLAELYRRTGQADRASELCLKYLSD